MHICATRNGTDRLVSRVEMPILKVQSEMIDALRHQTKPYLHVKQIEHPEHASPIISKHKHTHAHGHRLKSESYDCV